MKYSTLAFLLSLTLGPLTSTSFAADATADTAPAIPVTQLHALHWQTLSAGETTELELSTAGQTLSQPHIAGKVLALQLPADRGTLTLRLRSLIENNQVYAPNVLILDQQQQPAAFYSSNQFSYQPASLFTGDRLEGTIKLSPAPGQQYLYALIYTSTQDLSRQTTLEGAAKAYAKATGNQPPAIPDPVAQHTSQGRISLKVTTEQNHDTITIGNHDTNNTVATPLPVIQEQSAQNKTAQSKPVLTKIAPLPETENYFNQQIKKAIKQGDMAQAMTLVEEAERLGSSSARSTFINSIQPRR